MSELRTNRIVPRDGIKSGASGGIIQVVSTTVTAASFTHNSESPALITGMVATITPTRSDSKVLVTINLNTTVSAANYTTMILLYRDGSVITGARGDAGGATQIRCFKSLRHSNSNVPQETSGMYLDSPGTTSATTYQVYVAQEGGSTMYLNRLGGESNVAYHPRATSGITLMEVSG